MRGFNAVHTAVAVAVIVLPRVEAAEADRALEEVVVTAQKREESLQDVPAAITALTPEDLVKFGIRDAQDLNGLMPNVSVTSFSGGLNVFIRGIGFNELGSGRDAGVAFHEDGVYVARPRSQVAGLFDVERMEVLRGPQGTLYGRNATGGVINVITKRPTDELSLDSTLRFGNYSRKEVEAAISGPLGSDRVKARLAAVLRQHDGYGKNVVTGTEIDDQDEWGARASFDFGLAQNANLFLTVEHFEADDHRGGFHYFGQGRPEVPLTGTLFGGVSTNSVRDYAGNVDPQLKTKVDAATARLTWDLSDTTTITSTTGWRRTESFLTTDIDETSSPVAYLTQIEPAHQISEELQLSWTNDKYTFIGGLYYFHENVEFVAGGEVGELFGPGAFFPYQFAGVGRTTALGAFANLDIKFTDRLNVTLGLRYSDEKRENDGSFLIFFPPAVPAIGEKSWSAVTPKFNALYTLTDDVSIYGSVSKGFKSGAFFIGNPQPAVDPEYVWAYEMGVKSFLFDRRLQANVSGFVYDYKDMQQEKINGLTLSVENAAKASIYGVEAELKAVPWQGGTMQLSLAWLDATFDEYQTSDPALDYAPAVPNGNPIDLSGGRLPTSPVYTAALGIGHDIAVGSGTLSMFLDGRWSDKYQLTPYNRPLETQGSFATLDARITFTPMSEKWHVALWGKNLTDELIISGGDTTTTPGFGLPTRGFLRDPRTYGLEFGVRM